VAAKIVEQTFPSREHKGLDEIVLQFLGNHRLMIKRACFGVDIVDGERQVRPKTKFS
jgi:hypothetical protein